MPLAVINGIKYTSRRSYCYASENEFPECLYAFEHLNLNPFFGSSKASTDPQFKERCAITCGK